MNRIILCLKIYRITAKFPKEERQPWITIAVQTHEKFGLGMTTVELVKKQKFAYTGCYVISDKYLKQIVFKTYHAVSGDKK